MKVKITESFRYADPGGPHLPQIDFVEGSVVAVTAQLGASVISNGHGVAVDDDVPETLVIQPDSKEEGLKIQSKDDGVPSEAYDKLSAKKKLFVDQYFVDSDGTQAAIRAGYSENTAAMRGAALLEDEDIAAAISERSE
ncbi:MAG: terminase small subunit [Nitrosomonadaceae bacterium]